MSCQVKLMTSFLTPNFARYYKLPPGGPRMVFAKEIMWTMPGLSWRSWRLLGSPSRERVLAHYDRPSVLADRSSISRRRTFHPGSTSGCSYRSGVKEASPESFLGPWGRLPGAREAPAVHHPLLPPKLGLRGRSGPLGVLPHQPLRRDVRRQWSPPPKVWIWSAMCLKKSPAASGERRSLEVRDQR
ncbi:hypothetical protein Nepgr_002040 [Nepenthes gracilis]|uniref:Uncharacterized protein n=1 Tax=Nepenthes gracilis TaxID=150966 RepID=A0AAD3RXY7_NEPGR|nr:hypothetical protein Nepgr_002040 [Nepenthes gracilis]